MQRGETRRARAEKGGGGASTCPGTCFGSKCVVGSNWNGGVRAMLRRHGRCSTAGRVGTMADSARAWSKSCREVCCGVLMWCRARARDRGGSRYTAVQWLAARSGRRGRHRLGVAWVLRCTNSSGGSPGECASYSGYGMPAGLVYGTERMSGARGGRSLVWSGLDWKDG
jgi:hypothetical protein